MKTSSKDLVIDFDNNHIDYQRKNISKKNILAKAIGYKSAPYRVLDLTAGLGIDAVHLSMLGCQVTSLERNKDLFHLLETAQLKSMRPEIKQIQFVFADAKDFIKRGLAKNFDVIYYDPMFPEKKKSALPRKEMKLFRELVGNDSDIVEVINLALKENIKRLVVKRPKKAELLLSLDKKINVLEFDGTTISYQVFLQNL